MTKVSSMIEETNFPTPQQIVDELDKYIIGQHEAKRHVAIALRNRWRRMQVKSDMQKEIVPNNILMIGATGVGKTEIARRLAKIARAPFVKVEASKFTEVGYVGRDVESMVRDLVEQAVGMLKTEKEKQVREKALETVENMLLDLLIPPVKDSASDSDKELNAKTRERFAEKLRNGELEDRKVEIKVETNVTTGVSIMGGNILDEASLINLQEMLSGIAPKKTKKRKVPISEARRILLEEEIAKLIDFDEIKSEALKWAENSGIIFIDEIDKIAGRGSNTSGPDVSREGVQRDLLPIVEGCTVHTKYGVINTDHVLFIAAGAFHVAKPSDLIPELQGRFPIRVELNSLTKQDFVNILTVPQNSLTKQYIALLETENVHLHFTPQAIEAIADFAFQINTELENIGARRLHTVMSHLLNEILFGVPDKIQGNTTIEITEEMVIAKLSKLVKNKDLSQYIL
ncbi:MAG: ATP-dependent protease ATPase subunit HslU [Flammeovirgaceae bacterium]|nr:ATP-dependent protease ATPase subunit HslU [Flammeovirgaceae bacterium]